MSGSGVLWFRVGGYGFRLTGSSKKLRALELESEETESKDEPQVSL